MHFQFNKHGLCNFDNSMSLVDKSPTPSGSPVYKTLHRVLNDYGRNYWRLLEICRKNPRRPQIHDLRTMLRRSITALDLINEFVDSRDLRKLRKDLKKQTHALRSLRDFQVQDRVLKTRIMQKGLGQFRQFVHSNRKAEEKRCQKYLRSFRSRRALKRWLIVDKELLLIVDDPDKERRAGPKLQKIVAREFRKLKSSMAHADTSNLRTLHAARIQFRKFRYLWEFVAPIISMPKVAKIKMKTLQATLGETQDTVAMIQSLIGFLIEEKVTDLDPSLLTLLRREETKQEQAISHFQAERVRLLKSISPPLIALYNARKKSA